MRIYHCKKLPARRGNNQEPMKIANSINRILRRVSFFALLVLAGCASASVAPQTESGPATTGRPTTVFVYDFAATSQEVTLNQGIFQKAYSKVTNENVDLAQQNLANQTAQALSYQLVAELEAMGFYAIRLPRGTPPTGSNVLVVDGQFTDI